MSSSKPEQDVIQHFSHIHPLTVVTGRRFICDGCNTRGNGKTYRCAQCDYDLHDYCATWPHTLLSFKHPQHVLQLVFNGPKHSCYICDGSVEGLYYRCKVCDFDVHPLCTGLPQPAHVESVNSPASVEKRIPGSKPNLHPTQCHPNHGCGCGHKHQGQGQSKGKMLGFLTDITVKLATNLITSSLHFNHHSDHHSNHHSNHHSEDHSENYSEDYSENYSEAEDYSENYSEDV